MTAKWLLIALIALGVSLLVVGVCYQPASVSEKVVYYRLGDYIVGTYVFSGVVGDKAVLTQLGYKYAVPIYVEKNVTLHTANGNVTVLDYNSSTLKALIRYKDATLSMVLAFAGLIITIISSLALIRRYMYP